MRICGIDPGLRTTGYGVIEVEGARCSVIDAGTIRPDPSAPLSARLNQIAQDLGELLAETRPARLAVENVYSHYRHPQTAVLMGHVRGVVLLSAEQAHVLTAMYAATRIKRSLTGNGRASKAQMQQAIKLRLGLASIPEPHDVADALAIALCDSVGDSVILSPTGGIT